MNLTDKINVLELLIYLLNEHDNQLDTIIGKMEQIQHTIIQDSSLRKSVKEYNPAKQADTQNILVVDDDINLANSFKLILESVGHYVDTANTGLQAFYKINKKNYDLILLDLNLPDMMGNKVAEEIQFNHKQTNIIYITGYSELKPNHGNETLIKPIKPEQLIETATKKPNNQY
jgi:CheY-like chemotaxis protein